MAAATDKVFLKSGNINSVQFLNVKLAAGVKVYQGTAVCANSAGYGVPASDTAGLVFLGLAEETVDNSSGAAGDLEVQVQPIESLAFIEFDAVSPTQAWVGADVNFSDDHTVALDNSTTNDAYAGRCVEIKSSAVAGKVLVATLRPAVN